MSPQVRIGLSGWQYDAWRGDFYPERLPKRRWLEYVGERFPTVELNGSFYSLQRPSRYRAWAAAVPSGFSFAVKGGRFLTHMLHLRTPHQGLANFFASGVLELGDRLGPVLWQLPDGFAPDPALLEGFCAGLPRTFGAARRLASDHDDRVHLDPGDEDGTRPQPPDSAPIRAALEIRDPRAVTEAHLAILREHGIALVDSHAGPAWSRFTHDTGASFAYLRLHGAPRVYADGYSPQALGVWASRIAAHIRAGRDVFVYFDNDAERHAPWDALALQRIVRQRGLPSA
ncbi:DUF72 domain-containing protein [Curtobacterium ammoniigenes]|uniref:DUF72 domain-containing protein n=1 Tax=Curtobacterium ammoniigenes TaxID=395387 RepID=UPI00082EEE66|nr:DUF72 domain-containing protein [Curtobacterium ammoniigenes]